MKNMLRKRLLPTLILMMCLLSFCKVNSSAKVILTGQTQIDCAAQKVIDRCTNENMTDKQKLKAVYVYLVKNMTYSHRDGRVRVKVSAKDKKMYKMTMQTMGKTMKTTKSSKFKSDYRNLLTLQGTCKDMSGVMCILANKLGYKAGYCQGRYVRGNGSSVEHWWNYVIVDGKKTYFDVQAANDSFDRHHSMGAVMSFYKKSGSDSGWRRHHRG